MAKISWCIEITDDNETTPIKNHNDCIIGADNQDDRKGEIIGSENDYNTIVHSLCERVKNYQQETYAVSFYNNNILIVQTNIACNSIPHIYEIIK